MRTPENRNRAGLGNSKLSKLQNTVPEFKLLHYRKTVKQKNSGLIQYKLIKSPMHVGREQNRC